MDNKYEEKDKNTNVLANIFYFIHETVVAADKPISMLVGVLLPFIAPLLPALITADSLRKFMKFEDSWTWIAVISFELIGYLGMIAAVGAAMRLSKNKEEELKESLTWNRNFYLAAYVIYLVTLISANTILEIVNNVSLSHVLVILCLTIGLSISAGILNASRLYERDEKDAEEKLHQEKREDKLKVKAMKVGINPFQVKSTPMETHNSDTFLLSNLVKPSLGQVQQFESTDWRVVKKNLTKKQIEVIFISDPKLTATTYQISERTARNWKVNAEKEMTK